ncbi:MAG: DUF92 domain-containing protein [Armatimonadota bacterium]|nr:DUF92 domain-containing protein [Armatimonadota bacterium]
MFYAVAVAVAARLAGLLTPFGALAAAAVGSVIWEQGGWPYAIPLLVFFTTGSLLGRLPGGAAKEGPRTAAQVLANGAVAALAVLIPGGATAYASALCAANSDTWATEIGTRLGRKPVRITTLEPAARGASGAVTIAGLAGSAAGAALIAVMSIPIPGALPWVVASAGFLGSLFDSLLGDTFQAKFVVDGSPNETGGTLVAGVPWLRNNAVNFAMTLFAGTLGYLLG